MWWITETYWRDDPEYFILFFYFFISFCIKYNPFFFFLFSNLLFARNRNIRCPVLKHRNLFPVPMSTYKTRSARDHKDFHGDAEALETVEQSNFVLIVLGSHYSLKKREMHCGRNDRWIIVPPLPWPSAPFQFLVPLYKLSPATQGLLLLHPDNEHFKSSFS